MQIEKIEQKIDLVVLIDTNYKMNKITKSIYSIITRLLGDLNNINFTFLRIPNTKYLKNNNYIFSYNSYLKEHSLHNESKFTNSNVGVHAINEICKYYPWQDFYKRKILYISDTTLTSNTQSNINDFLQTAYAINTALKYKVNISSHFLSYHDIVNSYSLDKTQDIYKNLSLSSNSLYEFINKPCKALYNKLIFHTYIKKEQINLKDIKPNISISIQNNQLNKKVLNIKVQNSYANITFDDFSIGTIQISDQNHKKIKNILQIKRNKEIYFGKISRNKNGEKNIVSKQIMINEDIHDLSKFKVNLNEIHYNVNYDYEEKSNCVFQLLA